MRLNKPRKKLDFKYIFLIFIITIIIIITILSFVINDNRHLSPIESGIKNVVVYFQKIIYTPFRYLENKLEEKQEMKKIYKDYKIDQNKLEKAKLLEEENKELKKEIVALKDQLSLNQSLTDYKIINATVISRNVGEWYNTITLDKGRHHGLTNDMAVIVNQGLVGRIIKTTSYTSEVKLITTSDLNSKISVGVSTDDGLTYGLLTGFDYQNNYILVEGIIDSLTIKKGDVVTTSGLSNLFPKGILIGKVHGITNGEFGLSKTIQIVPSVNFNDIRFVSVLKRKEIKP